jgi:hypothetical protein
MFATTQKGSQLRLPAHHRNVTSAIQPARQSNHLHRSCRVPSQPVPEPWHAMSDLSGLPARGHREMSPTSSWYQSLTCGGAEQPM